MTISIRLTAADFLNYHLYTTSKSKVFKRKRTMAKYIFPICYTLFGISSYLNERQLLAFIFLFLAVLWFVLYPLLKRNSTRRFYQKYIAENYQNRLDTPSELTFDHDFVYIKDANGEHKIPTSNLEKVNKITDCYFLKLQSGTSLILPKNQIDAVGFETKMTELQLPIINETDWKWD